VQGCAIFVWGNQHHAVRCRRSVFFKMMFVGGAARGWILRVVVGFWELPKRERHTRPEPAHIREPYGAPNEAHIREPYSAPKAKQPTGSHIIYGAFALRSEVLTKTLKEMSDAESIPARTSDKRCLMANAEFPEVILRKSLKVLSFIRKTPQLGFMALCL
jgi:hypothetical protein